jgi:hypothetical protein
METVQIVLDKKLLHAREARLENLRKLEVQACEARDREGYSKKPQTCDESHLWEAEAARPAE